MTTSVDVVSADGTTQHWTYTAGYDEKDVPITGNNPNGDRAARKRISATTTETNCASAPAAAIVKYAKEAHIDVIILGRHGHGSMAALFVGSVAERVVRAAPWAV